MNSFIKTAKFHVDASNKLKKKALEYFGVNCYTQNRYATSDEARQAPMGLIPKGLAERMEGFENCWMSEAELQILLSAVETATDDNVETAVAEGKAALLAKVANPETAEVGLQGQNAIDAFQVVIDSAMDAGDEAAKRVQTKKSSDGVIVYIAIGPGTSKLVKDLAVGENAIGKKTGLCPGITVGIPSTAGNGSLDAKQAYAKAFSAFVTSSKVSVGTAGNFVTATSESLGI